MFRGNQFCLPVLCTIINETTINNTIIDDITISNNYDAAIVN